jgi:hypothetical protein
MGGNGTKRSSRAPRGRGSKRRKIKGSKFQRKKRSGVTYRPVEEVRPEIIDGLAHNQPTEAGDAVRREKRALCGARRHAEAPRRQRLEKGRHRGETKEEEEERGEPVAPPGTPPHSRQHFIASCLLGLLELSVCPGLPLYRPLRVAAKLVVSSLKKEKDKETRQQGSRSPQNATRRANPEETPRSDAFLLRNRRPSRAEGTEKEEKRGFPFLTKNPLQKKATCCEIPFYVSRTSI